MTAPARVLADGGPHVHGEWCGPGGRHLPVVVSRRRVRDLLRRTYWVRCWECDLEAGPERTAGDAHITRRRIER